MGKPLDFGGPWVHSGPSHPFVFRYPDLPNAHNARPTTVEARKLEYDCPPTPELREEGKLARIAPGPYSKYLQCIVDTKYYTYIWRVLG